MEAHEEYVHYVEFESQAYLKRYYSNQGVTSYPNSVFCFTNLYNIYQSLGKTNHSLTILDVGTGPSIAHSISAAPYASEIVLSDYAEGSRKVLQQWVDKDPQAYDWTPYFQHIVVDIEGGEEKDVPAREENLRSSIKAIVPCDATNDPPLPTEYMKQYDVVQSFMALECACSTRDDFVPILRRLAKLLKPNGTLIIYSTERIDSQQPAQYCLEGKWFKYIRLWPDFILESLTNAGFCDITRQYKDASQSPPDDPKSYGFYIATYKPYD